MDGGADVAETTYTPFQTKPDAAPVRLIVRRVKPTHPLRPDTAITPSSPTAMGRRWNWRPIIAATPRSRTPYATSSTAGLNHAVGALAANGAWLAVQVMAHNLARWTARLVELGERTVITKTLRRRVFALVGRSSARRLTLISPAAGLGNPVQSRLGPAASHSVPGLTASLQLTQRPRNLAPPRSRESPAAYPLAIPRIATPA